MPTCRNGKAGTSRCNDSGFSAARTDEYYQGFICWDFRPRSGTVGFFIPQTLMNHESKSNHPQVDASDSVVNLSIQTTLLTRPMADMSPARQLMICLGWLRLFQVIVSGPTKPAARRPSLYET